MYHKFHMSICRLSLVFLLSLYITWKIQFNNKLQLNHVLYLRETRKKARGKERREEGRKEGRGGEGKERKARRKKASRQERKKERKKGWNEYSLDCQSSSILSLILLGDNRHFKLNCTLKHTQLPHLHMKPLVTFFTLHPGYAITASFFRGTFSSTFLTYIICNI